MLRKPLGRGLGALIESTSEEARTVPTEAPAHRFA